MKRSLMVAVPIALLAMVGSYGILAQQDSQTTQQPGGMMGRGMMGRGMMMGPSGQMQTCPVCGMMVGALMMKTMTATSDGGVFVAIGNRLIRYDSQLNVVKDTEIKIDMNQMFASVQKMMENCPLCKAMQQSQTQARQ